MEVHLVWERMIVNLVWEKNESTFDLGRNESTLGLGKNGSTLGLRKNEKTLHLGFGLGKNEVHMAGKRMKVHFTSYRIWERINVHFI